MSPEAMQDNTEYSNNYMTKEKLIRPNTTRSLK